MCDCADDFKAMKKLGLNRPFLFKQFNVSANYAGLAVRGINRWLYPFVDMLNTRPKIPKYIIVIPDKDMITNFKANKFNTTMVMGSTIHYIIRQFDILLDRRSQNLLDKKPGAVAPIEFPHIVWVRMLKRPVPLAESSVFALRGKFNSVLEEQLLHCKNNSHRIMSIDIRFDEFDNMGNLTKIGKANFWREVDRAMKKFEAGDIKLLPRKFIPAKAQTAHTANLGHQRDSPKARKRLWSPDQRDRASSKSRASHRETPWTSHDQRHHPMHHRYHDRNDAEHSRKHIRGCHRC